MAKRCTNSSVLILAMLLLSGCAPSRAADAAIAEEVTMGVNYGLLGSNLPSPARSVALMSSAKIGKVRIYDTNAEVLSALANTNIHVAVSVLTELIDGIAGDAGVADQWVAKNLAAYPNTRVRYVIVGNELFSNPSLSGVWTRVLPAMQNLHASLVARQLTDSVKITTSLAMDILENSYPPSAGSFRADIATSLMQPILQFISSTQSYFFLNVYPYLTWASNSAQISLNYALFATGSDQVTVMDGQLKYTNLLDAQVDAVVAAMGRVGFGDTRIAIGETGWPTAGGQEASVANAQTYNSRLVRKTMASTGTPRRPGVFIPTYIFALYNEDQKTGPAVERYWGLYNPDASPVYSIALSR